MPSKIKPRICRDCKQPLTEDNWSETLRKYHHLLCVSCSSIRGKTYRTTYPDKLKTWRMGHPEQIVKYRRRQKEKRDSEQPWIIEGDNFIKYGDMKSEEIKKYKSEWFKSESGKKYQYNRREKSRNNRIVVLAHYGGSTIPKCIRCGFDDIRALQLDHVNGNGFIERKQLGGHQGIFRNIIKNGFPPGYQTLCANCNWIKVHEQREFVHNRIMGQDGNL